MNQPARCIMCRMPLEIVLNWPAFMRDKENAGGTYGGGQVPQCKNCGANAYKDSKGWHVKKAVKSFSVGGAWDEALQLLDDLLAPLTNGRRGSGAMTFDELRNDPPEVSPKWVYSVPPGGGGVYSQIKRTAFRCDCGCMDAKPPADPRDAIYADMYATLLRIEALTALIVSQTARRDEAAEDEDLHHVPALREQEHGHGFPGGRVTHSHVYDGEPHGHDGEPHDPSGIDTLARDGVGQ